MYCRYMLVATTPTACGIETDHPRLLSIGYLYRVATTPTACGIETPRKEHHACL